MSCCVNVICLMSVKRSIRIGFLIARELGRKYTRFLFLGFIIGFTASIVFYRAYPLFASSFISKTERIGIIGEYTPSSLPLSVQSLISHGLTKFLQTAKQCRFLPRLGRRQIARRLLFLLLIKTCSGPMAKQSLRQTSIIILKE